MTKRNHYRDRERLAAMLYRTTAWASPQTQTDWQKQTASVREVFLRQADRLLALGVTLPREC